MALKARSRLAALAAVAVLAFAGAYFGSPWVVAGDLMRAARDGDVAALQSHVDLPAVRASLKGQLDERLQAALARRSGRDDAFAALGALFGAAVVDKAVDAAVTPETLAQVLRTARAPGRAKSDAARTGGDAKPAKLKVGYALTGLNRFEARLASADRPNRRLILGLSRRGLFDWKLTDVQLPPD